MTLRDDWKLVWALSLAQLVRAPSHSRRAEAGRRAARHILLLAGSIGLAIIVLMYALDAWEIAQMPTRGTPALWWVRILPDFGKDENVLLASPRLLTIETAMEWIDRDELVEVTPDAVRVRKKVLACNRRERREADKASKADRRREKIIARCLFLLCVLAFLWLVACGGSGSNSNSVTPKGTTIVTVAGSTTTGAQTTTFTLNVQ